MYIFGASGHGKVTAEIAEENKITIDAFIDLDSNKKTVFNYPIVRNAPNDEQIELIISIGNNIIRKKIVRKNNTFNYINLIHPKSSVSIRAKIDIGTVIMAGVVINSDAIVGKHCIVNTNASIDHDCVIDDFVHISPNVALAGNVEIGEGSHIGIGASVIQGIKIGKWCTVGAGTVVIKDIPNGATVVGNPGRIIKIKEVNDL